MTRFGRRFPFVVAGTALLPFGSVTTTSAAATSAAAASCPLPTFGPGRDYHPTIDPRRFGPDVDNQWFPLTPGRVSISVGTKDGKRALDVVVPSARTRVIDGVATRVVEDRLYLGGRLEETTA